MDNTIELIVNVNAKSYNVVEIETNHGNHYSADLSRFKTVHCYPSPEEWYKVSVDSYGLDLVWPSRFEVHIDQILANAVLIQAPVTLVS